MDSRQERELSRSRRPLTQGYGVVQSELPPHEQGRIDPRDWFDDSQRSFEIEIGCGKGGFLVSRSKADSTVRLLGIEWANKYFRYCADRLAPMVFGTGST